MGIPVSGWHSPEGYRAIREEGVSWPQVLSDAQDGGVTEAINGRFNVIGIPTN